MDQRVEVPSTEDVDRIARMLLFADRLLTNEIGEQLDGSLADLNRLQRLLDRGSVARDQTVELQAIGLAFGKVFVENTMGFDWWMVEDDYGRDPAVGFGETSLLLLPQTMLSKRVEEGEILDVG